MSLDKELSIIETWKWKEIELLGDPLFIVHWIWEKIEYYQDGSSIISKIEVVTKDKVQQILPQKKINLDRAISIIAPWTWNEILGEPIFTISWRWEKVAFYQNEIGGVAFVKDDSKSKVQDVLWWWEFIDTQIIGEITKIPYSWNLDIVYADINNYYKENYPHIYIENNKSLDDDFRFEIVAATDENFITKNIHMDETKSTKNFIKKMNQEYARKNRRK